MNVKEKLQAILAAANTTTGETDTTLTDAVQSLIDGYGGGGGLPAGIEEIASGTFSVPSTPTGATEVSHGMSQPPKFFVVYNSNFIDDTANSLVAAFAEFGKTTVVGGRRVVGTSVWGTYYHEDNEENRASVANGKIKIPSSAWSFARLQPTNGGETIVYRWIAWR